MRVGLAILAVAAFLLAGFPGDAIGPDRDATTSRIDYRSGSDQGSATVVDAGGVIVRVGCPTHGTATGPYLSLTARTDVDDASVNVVFDSRFHGRHRFGIDDFDRSYGRWDLLGAEPGPVEGRFVYRSSDGVRIELEFEGSGGRADGQCDLRGQHSDRD